LLANDEALASWCSDGGALANEGDALLNRLRSEARRQRPFDVAALGVLLQSMLTGGPPTDPTAEQLPILIQPVLSSPSCLPIATRVLTSRRVCCSAQGRSARTR